MLCAGLLVPLEGDHAVRDGNRLYSAATARSRSDSAAAAAAADVTSATAQLADTDSAAAAPMPAPVTSVGNGPAADSADAAVKQSPALGIRRNSVAMAAASIKHSVHGDLAVGSGVRSNFHGDEQRARSQTDVVATDGVRLPLPKVHGRGHLQFTLMC